MANDRGRARRGVRPGAAPAGRHRARPRPALRRVAAQARAARRRRRSSTMLNLRLREQMREAVIGQAELESGAPAGRAGHDRRLRRHRRLHRARRAASGRTSSAPWSGASSARVADAVEPPVRLVKTIGDAAMLVSPEPDAAGRGRPRASSSARRRTAPLLRGGVALRRGALPRAGDWYGRPVNLASRLTAFARRGSVLTSKEVRDAAGDGYRWSFAGSQRFKGVKGVGRRVPRPAARRRRLDGRGVALAEPRGLAQRRRPCRSSPT